MTDTQLADGVDRTKAAFDAKLALYRQKLSEADPFAAGHASEWDRYRFALEVLELTGEAMGLITEADFEVVEA